MQGKINFVAMAAAVSTLVLVVVSWFVPWWRLTMGNNPEIALVNVSPVNINLTVLSTPLTIPLMWAISIVGLLTLTVGAIVLLIYSVKPNKPYSMKLLGFGYKKPLGEVIILAISLVGLSFGVANFAGVAIPIVGSGTMTLPGGLTGGQNVAVNVTTSFEWPFYFAIAVAGLCVAARLYHKKAVANTDAYPLPPPPPPTAQ
jgi:hypothetical protein